MLVKAKLSIQSNVAGFYHPVDFWLHPYLSNNNNTIDDLTVVNLPLKAEMKTEILNCYCHPQYQSAPCFRAIDFMEPVSVKLDPCFRG